MRVPGIETTSTATRGGERGVFPETPMDVQTPATGAAR